MAQMIFNAATVAPSSAFDPIPAGWYVAKIVQSEIRQTNKKDGHYIWLAMQVLNTEHAGRVVFDQLNIDNPNPKAVEIGYGSLSAICHATDVIDMQDTEQLHGIPLEVKVAIAPAEGQYAASNQVKGYRGLPKQQNAAPMQPAGAPPQAWAPAPAAQPPAQQFAAPPAAPAAWAPPAQQQAPQAWAPPAAQQAPAPVAQPAPAWASQPAAQPPMQAVAGPAAGAQAGIPPWQR
jgi:hypothetical protein